MDAVGQTGRLIYRCYICDKYLKYVKSMTECNKQKKI